MKRNITILALSLVLVSACVSSNNQKQISIVSEYLDLKPKLEAEFKEALNTGKIIRGMSVREALIAGGVIAADYKNLSIWSHTGLILRPPKPSFELKNRENFVFLIKNRTQFNNSSFKEFSVFFSEIKKLQLLKKDIQWQFQGVTQLMIAWLQN